MSPPDLAAILAAHDRARGAGVLKEDARGRVTRVPYDATSDAVVKELREGGLRRRLDRAVRGARAERTAQVARELAAAGLPVPELLGARALEGRSLYVARHVPGPTLAAALRGADPVELRRLALAAAELAARLHAAGFAPRDFKPVNLIVAPGGGLVLVDLDDVRRAAPPSPARPLERRHRRALAALDAYAQLDVNPPGVRLRWEALARYAGVLDLEPRAEWRGVLALSRAKRRRLSGAR